MQYTAGANLLALAQLLDSFTGGKKEYRSVASLDVKGVYEEIKTCKSKK